MSTETVTTETSESAKRIQRYLTGLQWVDEAQTGTLPDGRNWVRVVASFLPGESREQSVSDAIRTEFNDGDELVASVGLWQLLLPSEADNTTPPTSIGDHAICVASVTRESEQTERDRKALEEGIRALRCVSKAEVGLASGTVDELRVSVLGYSSQFRDVTVQGRVKELLETIRSCCGRETQAALPRVISVECHLDEYPNETHCTVELRPSNRNLVLLRTTLAERFPGSVGTVGRDKSGRIYVRLIAPQFDPLDDDWRRAQWQELLYGPLKELKPHIGFVKLQGPGDDDLHTSGSPINWPTPQPFKAVVLPPTEEELERLRDILHKADWVREGEVCTVGADVSIRVVSDIFPADNPDADYRQLLMDRLYDITPPRDEPLLQKIKVVTCESYVPPPQPEPAAEVSAEWQAAEEQAKAYEKEPIVDDFGQGVEAAPAPASEETATAPQAVEDVPYIEGDSDHGEIFTTDLDSLAPRLPAVSLDDIQAAVPAAVVGYELAHFQLALSTGVAFRGIVHVASMAELQRASKAAGRWARFYPLKKHNPLGRPMISPMLIVDAPADAAAEESVESDDE